MILLKHARITRHLYPTPCHPKKRRFPMTAVAGFLCHDGIVISAETEESYGDDKAYSHKIFPLEREDCRLAVAGSGSGYLIDYANAQIAAAIESAKNNGEFETQVRSILNRLYSEEFKNYPVNHPSELQIQLLIAAQFRVSEWMEPVLFECRG